MNLKPHQIAFIAALILAAVVVAPMCGAIASICFLVVIATVLNPRSSKLCVTLSVPEILMDTMDAFKSVLPFFRMVSTDFSSKTAVKGDKITAHVSQLPTVQAYDATNGFNNSPANSTTLIQDVSVTLSSFNHVPVQIRWLDQLSAKKPLYKEAVRNLAYVLAKKVVDDLLQQITFLSGANTGAFVNKITVPNTNVSLDTMEAIRTQLNSQFAADRGRFGIVSSGFASALQNDDRVKSSLFYAQLNGDQGYRHFRNISGFSDVVEYPAFPATTGSAGTTTNNLSAFFGDPRSLVIANRRVDFSNAAAELGAPEIIRFYPMTDDETGLEMTGVLWQAQNTGDVFVSAAVLYGVNAGANVTGETTTVATHGTDNAGVIITNG